MRPKLTTLHCPRCGNIDDLREYDDSFDCLKCKMEFSKSDLDEFEDQDILSIEEKSEILKSMYCG